jgi:hypothetical protein
MVSDGPALSRPELPQTIYGNTNQLTLRLISVICFLPMFLTIHPQPMDLAVIASAFAASIYWVTEGKERKIRRQRKIRHVLRVWITIKKELKPVAPLFKGIEHVISLLSGSSYH